jgi:hypothetical protein
MARKGDNGSVVKIDSDLFKKVEDFILKEENRLKFVNKKQFIDLAVNEFLTKMKKGGKDEKK